MTARMTRAFRTLKAGKDSGQGALEYIGILAVVVVIVGIALAAFEGTRESVISGVAEMVTTLLGGGGAAAG